METLHIKVYRNEAEILQDDTPFLMSNFARFGFSCSLFSVGYLKKKVGFYVIFGMIFITVYSFMYGCFESMDFCVSHTFFISSLTSFTSATYTLPVAFMRFAI